MLIAVISGVESNADALRAILTELDARQPDYIFATGDLVGRGPKPRQVLELLGALRILSTRGPWDAKVAGLAEPDGGDEEAWVSAARALLGARGVESLHQLPESQQVIVAGQTIAFGQHLSSESSEDQGPDALGGALEAASAGINAEVVAVGSAIGLVRRTNGRLLISTGSVGHPVAGDPRAAFALVRAEPHQEATAEIVTVPYPLLRNVRATKRLAKKGLISKKVEIDYLLSLLGNGAPRLEPLAPDDSGATLLVKLLAHRAHAVYARGSHEWPQDSDELVHDLRVASRRLREAVAIARRVLGKRIHRKIADRAQELGRALGERRMADVFIAEVRKHHAEHAEQHPSFLRLLEERRHRATLRVLEVFPRKRLLRHGLDVLAAAMDPKDQSVTFAALVKPHLLDRADRVEPLFAGVKDPSAVGEHHLLRIALKKLRYSAEITGEAYPGLVDPEQVLKPLRTLQDGLGDLHDTHELRELVKSHRASAGLGKRATEDLVERLDQQAEKRHRAALEAVGGTGALVLSRLRAAAEATG